MNWSLPLRFVRMESRSRARKALRRAPVLEVLEDRTTPSTSNVTIMTNLPAATHDWADTDGTTPVAISVLDNDSPSAGGTLVPGSVKVVSAPLHGKATVNPTTGEITYHAFFGFAGTDTFKYVVKDSLGHKSNAAKVSVQINRPVASDDWVDTDGTNPVNIPVLENDTDPEGNEHIVPSLVTKLSSPFHGNVTLNADGTFTYQANPGFTGTDTFRYSVTDDHGGESLGATVFVQVNGPTANDDLASFSGSGPVTIHVLDNDTDPDGNEHLDPGMGAFVTPTSGALHGQVTPNADGTFTYQPNPGFVGTDSFRYTVTDDAGATSKSATVTVVSTTVNGASDDLTDTDGSTPVAVTVLANDSAPLGGHLIVGSLAVTSTPKHGKAVIHGGLITYTAAAGFTGTDTFRYSVKATTSAAPDSPKVLLQGTVSVRVNRPVAADDWIDTDGTSPVTIDVLGNDQDPEGHEAIEPGLQAGAAVHLVTQPQNGKVTKNADGSFTYTAKPGFSGTDHFRYSVTDDAGATSTPATVFIRVNVPTAANDFAQADGTHPVTIDVLANDQDPDGNEHIVPGEVKIFSQPKHGHVTVNSSGQIIYTADQGWGGTDTFRYTIGDDAGATSAPGTVTVITVIPVARNGKAVLHGVRSTQFDVLSVASDPSGASALDNAVVTITGAPQHGHATVDPVTHAIKYTANPGYFGLDTIRYTITDDLGDTSRVATLTVDLEAAL